MLNVSTIRVRLLVCMIIPACLFAAGMTVAVYKDICPASVSTALATPWQSVGGCGAGGSGGGGAGKAKWIGMGVTGHRFELEVMGTSFTGQNFRLLSLTPRLGYELTYTNRIGLTVPYVSNTGSLQPATNYDLEEGTTTGGLGDIAFDYSKNFGMSGQFSLSIGLSVPTGQYDIKRGKLDRELYVPQNLQKGSGLFQPSLGFGYSQDIMDEFMLLVDVSYSHPVAINLSGKNRKYYYPDKYPDTLYDWYGDADKNGKRFDYYFKPYGENDLGAYFPPSLSLAAFWGFRGIEYFVHSVGFSLSCPLGVAWIASNDFGTSYNPRPDPDHQAWSGSVVYGVQCSKLDWLPLFLAITLPIHDRTAQNSGTSPDHWDPPDWKDFGQQLKISIGMKAGLL